MRVLFVTTAFPQKESDKDGNFVFDSASSLTKLGHQVDVLVVNRPSVGKLVYSSEVSSQVNSINSIRAFSIPRHYGRSISNYVGGKFIAKKIIELTQNFDSDIVHVHGEILAIAAGLAHEKIGVPYVVTLHGIETCQRMWSKLASLQYKKALTMADKVVLVGEPLRSFYKKICGSDQNFIVISNGFRLPKGITRKHPLFSDGVIKIISVSNLHEGKGLDILLKALAKLKNNGINNWIYQMVGSGDQEKYLRNLVADLGLNEQVQFIGYCQHDRVYKLLGSADIFCLPSYREAFGIAYLEAMAFSLVTIGVQGQGPSAFIDSGKNGFLVKPQDVSSLVNVLTMIVSNPSLAIGVAKSGQKRVLEGFTLKHHAKHLKEVYAELI